MKKRRLNILLIAIIALAAAPQALQDAYRLVNAAQERAEDHFWSVFLSYQTPRAENPGATEQVAANRTHEAGSCPLERVAAGAEREASPLKRGVNSSPARSLQAAGRTMEKAKPEVDEEMLAELEEASRALVSAREKSAARIASLHAGETQKAAEAASKASMAYSFVEMNESTMKVRQVMELDKLRQRPRNIKGRGEPVEPPMTPNPNRVGSM